MQGKKRSSMSTRLKKWNKKGITTNMALQWVQKPFTFFEVLGFK